MLTNEVLSAFRTSLFAGHYNLLLGSGVSLDSTDSKGKLLKSASDLAADLCVLKDVPVNTPLARVANLLNKDEVEKYITSPYSFCRAGETVKRLTTFVWRTVFTLNVDDALEAAYATTTHTKQEIESLNYDTIYKTPTNKGHLPLVHLHGFTREPEKGYVFSTNEYGRITRGMNPWMHVLSELIASEPFIIAGTTLNESDLDYYLSGRTETSGRTNRGPSLFVEPYPNKITENLCSRHGLILVPAKLSEFLKWLVQAVGNPPTVAELIIPSHRGIFKKPPPPEVEVDFFTCFELVRPSTKNPEGEVSPFHFGRPARWSDLEAALDVPTDEEREFSAKARNLVGEIVPQIKMICAISGAGTGKTTQIRRAAYDLAKEGHLVFNLNAKSALDSENLVQILSAIDRPVVLVIDGVADHAPALRTLMLSVTASKPLLILAADRDYRRDHIDRILGDLEIEFLNLYDWRVEAYEQLLERLRRAGLLGDSDAVRDPKRFALRLLGDSVAIATCRALKNFLPLDVILKSLWNDASEAARRSYAIAAIGEHCYAGGLYHPILEAAYPNNRLADQLQLDCPLPLAYSDEGDFVLPMHPVIADRLLFMLARERPELMLELFSALANALSPYVNRRTSIDRTPEALLAARLFNSERVTRPLLGKLAETFYVDTREAWQWNSRYWEQRALFTQANNIDAAIQFARHAVAIEAHPFPWTTLASLLTKKMETVSVGVDALFTEIYDLLNQVIQQEATRFRRPTPHPFATLFHATQVLLVKGGSLSPRRKDWIIEKIRYCGVTFGRDLKLNSAGSQIVAGLSIKK
jgi:SIR2-like domain